MSGVEPEILHPWRGAKFCLTDTHKKIRNKKVVVMLLLGIMFPALPLKKRKAIPIEKKKYLTKI